MSTVTERPMSLEYAEAIYEQVIAAVTPHCGIPFEGKPPALPDVPLAEMLEAMRIMAEMPREKSVDAAGREWTALRFTVEERLLAGVFAMQRYGGIRQLADGLGFRVVNRRSRA